MPKPTVTPARGSTKKGARKVAVKQPLPVPERLRRLFTSLCAQIDGGHFGNAIKTCDKVLRLEPDDVDAVQTKLFLLLQTEQYSAALTLTGDDDARYAFERAYSLYRLQRESDTVQLLQKLQEDKQADRGVLHLQAQMSYRQGSYQVACDLYSQLLDSAEPQSDEYSDILTNLQAAQMHLDFINKDFLRALDTLPSSLTAALESSPPPQPTSSIAAVLATAAHPAAAAETPFEKRKKVRTKRVPAGVVPGVTPPPDPERWLKKSERSTFAQANKRRKGGGGGGATQGASVVDQTATSVVSTVSVKSGGQGKGKKKK